MHIYIHIPFCSKKCSYCKFAITPIFDTFKKTGYLKYLKKEILEGKKKYRIQTLESIYFGGGTPSLLTKQEIQEILALFEENITETTEITLEGNPEDFDADFVRGISAIGINRVSLGVQSLNEKTLKTVGRSEVSNIHNALKNLSKIPHISLNIDLILGLPYSKKGDTIHDLKSLHKSYKTVTHTSMYMLEKGDYPKNWNTLSMNENEICDEFLEIIEYSRAKGWNHYEYSNWAKPGYECKHNRGYWNHSDSIGFGLSASSYFQGKRWTNSLSFAGYYRGEKYSKETLTYEQIRIEKVIFGLRTNGIDSDVLNQTKELDEYRDKGYLIQKNKKYQLTKKGIPIIDRILSDIV